MSYNKIILSLIFVSLHSCAMGMNGSSVHNRIQMQHRDENDASPRSVAFVDCDTKYLPKCVQQQLEGVATEHETAANTFTPACVQMRRIASHDNLPVAYLVDHIVAVRAQPLEHNNLRNRSTCSRRFSSYDRRFTEDVIQEENMIERFCDLICPCFKVAS